MTGVLRIREANLELEDLTPDNPLDAKTGHLLSSPYLPGWGYVDLVIPISSSFGLPIHLENDVNAAALFGAGRTSSSVYYMTVSNGIGGSYVHEKKLIRGANGYAGEIGNTIIDSFGPYILCSTPGLLAGRHSNHAPRRRKPRPSRCYSFYRQNEPGSSSTWQSGSRTSSTRSTPRSSL